MAHKSRLQMGSVIESTFWLWIVQKAQNRLWEESRLQLGGTGIPMRLPGSRGICHAPTPDISFCDPGEQTSPKQLLSPSGIRVDHACTQEDSIGSTAFATLRPGPWVFWWEMQKPQNYIRFSPKSRVENKTERLRLIFQCPRVHWKIRRIRSVFSSTPISDGKHNCFCESCIHKLKNLRSRVAGCTNRSILRIPSVLERKVVSK